MADAPELSRINTHTQLDDLLEKSSEHPVWIFKHSLICPTSSRAWGEFERFAARRLAPGSVRESMAVVEIQRARDVSREVEARTNVRHESPQVLLVQDGRAVWHASHWDITEQALVEAAARSTEHASSS